MNYKNICFQLSGMMILTVLTQIVLLLKASITASLFGIGSEMDAFNLTNNVGGFIYSFIGAGVTTVLIPNLISKKFSEGVNTFITTLYSLGFILFLFMLCLGPKILNILLGLNSSILSLCISIFPIITLSHYINSFLGTTNALFQCNNEFNKPKLISLITSIFFLIGLLTIPMSNIHSYVWLNLFIIIFTVILHIILLGKSNYKFKFSFQIKNHHFINMIKSLIPILMSTGLYQLTLICDTFISSGLGEGQISILNYSNFLLSMINTLFLGNILLFLYPKITILINEHNNQFKFFNICVGMNIIMSLLVVEFIIVGKEGITLLYERGNFTSQVTNLVFICTILYMLSLPINAVRDLIYRYFYAKSDTLTPFKNSIIISCLNIAISLLLSYYIGIYGIILGTVITSVFSLVMIIFRLNRKYGISVSKIFFVLENFKVFVVVCITTLLMLIVKVLFPIQSIFLAIIVYGLFTIGLFFIFLRLTKVKIIETKAL